MRSTAFRVTVAAVMLGISGGFLRAEEDAPPAQIDLSKFPATKVQDVIVPNPSEVFIVLDKLRSPNWKAEFRKGYALISGDRAHKALLLGALIADGFIAVQAKDNEDVRYIGRLVLDFAAALGVRDSVIKHYSSIQEAADAGDWGKVRIEFDKTQSSVRSAMVELGDDQLAELVSLGGWLRGTEVLTSIVAKDYTADGAELLHQPDLLGYFERQIDGMSKFKKHKLVQKIDGELKTILPMISADSITSDSVKKIKGITNELLQQIMSKEA